MEFVQNSRLRRVLARREVIVSAGAIGSAQLLLLSGLGPKQHLQNLSVRVKLQVLVYDILPSTTAVFSYAIGSRKLSASEQFFVGAQTVVSLLQTTQILSDICFMLPCCLRQLK